MAKENRLKTKIKGFDALVSGGFPKGRSILLSGSPGTGKTIFSLNLANNVASNGGVVLYVTFEEDEQSLQDQAKMFGWDFKTLQKKRKLYIEEISTSSITENTVKKLIARAEKIKCDLLVIDSLSALAINTPTTFVSPTEVTNFSIQRFMYQFINTLQRSNVTSLLIAQSYADKLSTDGVSDFICDGVIHIKYDSLGGKYSRHLIVRKMRQTKNDEDIHPVEITKKGIVIHHFGD